MPPEKKTSKPATNALKPRLHLICNAHIDPYWQWDWEEGAAVTVSTFRTAADCCDLSDSLIFCHNESLLYGWVEKYEPELFSRIREHVRAGRWHIMGGWHIQPDCNLPSGESFVRQMLIGRRWFKKQFGVEPRTAINFDSFGHTRGLVQLLRKSGYDSYIFTRPKDADCPLPAHEFTWVGYDGSEITAARCECGYATSLGKAVEEINDFKEKQPPEKPVTLRLWGVGNHGGGPSRKDSMELDEYIRNTLDMEVKHSTPEAYFDDLRSSGMVLPRVERDLNAWAVGCYTSQVRIKQKHRKLESELFLTEKMASNAAMQKCMEYPAGDFLAVMHDLATAQFHDILPGSSVQEVEESALRLMDHGLEILARIKAQAFFAHAAGEPAAAECEIPILIYNPHPWPVKGIWECETMLAEQNWKDEFTLVKVFKDGIELPSQIEKESSNLTVDWRKRVAFVAELAPSSMNRFDCRLEVAPRRPQPQLQPVDGRLCYDNNDVQVEIDTSTGWINRYTVKGVDYLKGQAFRLLVVSDNEDPWGMHVNSFREFDGAFALLPREVGSRFSGLRPENVIDSVRVVEDGPARTVVEAVFGFGDSFAVQTYKIPKNGAELEIQVRVLWNEKNRMLKWSVPTNLSGDRCLGQVACGVESFPTTGNEFAAHQWVIVTDDTRNLALSIANDGIYGSDCKNGELRMSLLRSPAYCGHPIFDRPIVMQDRFLPRIDQGEHIFNFRVHASSLAERLERIDREALMLNQRPMALSFFPSGQGTALQAGVTIEDDLIQLQALKRRENGDGWIIRLFNPTADVRQARLIVPRFSETISMTIEAFELKTLSIAEDALEFVETDLMEQLSP